MSSLVVYVEGNVNGDSMGDEWDDLEIAAENFADFLNVRYTEFLDSENVYYTVDIKSRSHEIDKININVFGDDDSDPTEETMLEEHLIEMKNRLWTEFCEAQDS